MTYQRRPVTTSLDRTLCNISSGNGSKRIKILSRRLVPVQLKWFELRKTLLQINLDVVDGRRLSVEHKVASGPLPQTVDRHFQMTWQFYSV